MDIQLLTRYFRHVKNDENYTPSKGRIESYLNEVMDRPFLIDQQFADNDLNFLKVIFVSNRFDSLDVSNVKGEIWDEIGKTEILSKVKKLRVYNSSTKGLFKNYKQLVNIESVEIRNDNNAGLLNFQVIDDEVANLDSLKKLVIASKLPINLSDEFFKIKNLKSLGIEFSLEKKVSLSRLKNLEELLIQNSSGNLNVDWLVDELVLLSQLSMFAYYDAENERVPNFERIIGQLKTLSLSMPKVIEFPEFIRRGHNLEKLFLGTNTMEIPNWILGLEQLRVLKLGRLENGSLPSFLNDHASLKKIDLTSCIDVLFDDQKLDELKVKFPNLIFSF